MPRQARKESGTGIYHVMLRGINRQDIFEDAEDYMRMLTKIKDHEDQKDQNKDQRSKIRGRFFDPEEIEKNKKLEKTF